MATYSKWHDKSLGCCSNTATCIAALLLAGCASQPTRTPSRAATSLKHCSHAALPASVASHPCLCTHLPAVPPAPARAGRPACLALPAAGYNQAPLLWQTAAVAFLCCLCKQADSRMEQQHKQKHVGRRQICNRWMLQLHALPSHLQTINKTVSTASVHCHASQGRGTCPDCKARAVLAS